MKFAMRPIRVPTDYVPVSTLLSTISLNPITPEKLLEEDDRLPAGTIRQRLVATSEGGELIGFGTARHYPFERTGRFTLTVHVGNSHRRQGIGSRLLAAGEQFAREHGATSLRTMIRDDDPASLAYAEQRGYVKVRQSFWSSLQVDQFDETAFADVIRAVERSGIRFATLADEPGAATEQALYELDRHASADNPGEDLPDFLPFEEWRKLTVASPSVRPELFIFARDGKRIIGMTDMSYSPETGSIYTGFTGVHRSYRGRGLALALKVLAVGAAKRIGAVVMRTQNDSLNGAMLAVNRKLGYVPAPGTFELIRTL